MTNANVCCLCGGTYQFGCNPAPLADSSQQCCEKCNWEKVLPARGIQTKIPYDEFIKLADTVK